MLADFDDVLVTVPPAKGESLPIRVLPVGACVANPGSEVSSIDCYPPTFRFRDAKKLATDSSFGAWISA